ncbi:MAG: acetyl-CoA C-acyltransferase [Candidatus Hodarchaeota archaeon]
MDKQYASAGAGMHMLAMEIMIGYTKCALTTGFEHMTRVRRIGIDPAIERYKDKNSLFYHPEYDMVNSVNMLQTAQRLYEEEIPKFTKDDLDKFGVRSHNLTIRSQEEKWFTSRVNGGEIIPIEGHVEESMMVERDMAARKSTLEGVAGLHRISIPFYLEKNGGKNGYFEREGTEEGVITAGNSSPLNAGATAAVLMEVEGAEKKNLEPLARIVSIGWAGGDPRVMGRGPVPATRKALELANLTAVDFNFWEINEAFCIVALNCMNKFNIPEKQVNIKGGSTAIGHPLGATIIRLTGTLARILREKKGRYGVDNACVGGGQGIATIIENLDA